MIVSQSPITWQLKYTYLIIMCMLQRCLIDHVMLQ